MTEGPTPSPEKLKQAQERLTRMEETQKLCFRHQNNLPLLAEELQKQGFKEFEITYLLEPKEPRNLPGYKKSEIERQRQFVNYLSSRTKPAGGHRESIEHESAADAGPAIG